MICPQDIKFRKKHTHRNLKTFAHGLSNVKYVFLKCYPNLVLHMSLNENKLAFNYFFFISV